MAQVVPLRHLFLTGHHCYCSYSPTVYRLLSSVFTSKKPTHFSFSSSPFSRNSDIRSQGLRFTESSIQEAPEESDLESATKKSRNEKKREARRAFRWGIDLATFSPPQIKRILKVASLETEVFDALMLVKRLGPDVREGKRRQFNYIGRLLRKVEPELMDALIQASKDGDDSRLQELSGQGTWTIEDDEEEGEETDSEEEGCHKYVDVATRWFDGLIERDSFITNEVYSIHNVEFDRQDIEGS
eukprot:TRINITY_DN5471_c0_g1_i1.p1 TRINITY_DN5471_c0_g1~~TRINITY_DN5471_c0_g1_i1.p1  ORF type:complete len:243 (-),score=45.81 TRINITY_DN5471_c0_g1_i1:104-832(-)